MLLDEATSALDSHSEKIVQFALDQASKDRTTIIVSHRLSTITNVDKIYFIEKGSVIEEGPHTELLAKKGAYFNLVNANNSLSIDHKHHHQSKSSIATLESESSYQDSENFGITDQSTVGKSYSYSTCFEFFLNVCEFY